MAELNIRIRISRPVARWAAVAALLGALGTELSTEKFGLSTYYPAPSGVYSGVVSSQGALLARDAASNQSKVGVGTTSPQYALDVSSDVGASQSVTAVGAVSGADVRVGTSSVMTSLANCSAANWQCQKTSSNTLQIALACGALNAACCPDGSCHAGGTCAGGVCKPVCSVSSWTQIGACGAGCAVGTRLKSPACAPAGCSGCPGNSCQADASCPAACSGIASWADGSCGPGACPVGQRQQTPVCSPSGCVGSCGSARCVADASCPPACTGVASWTNGNCGPGACPAGQRQQTPACSPSGCAGSCGSPRCQADSTCPCGGQNQACCNGSCTLSYNICSGGTCVLCGNLNQPCCGGNVCYDGNVCGGGRCGAPCRSNGSCTGCSPSCNSSCTGHDNCGNSCKIYGSACPPPPAKCGSVCSGCWCIKYGGPCGGPVMLGRYMQLCTCNNGSVGSCGGGTCCYGFCGAQPTCP